MEITGALKKRENVNEYSGFSDILIDTGKSCIQVSGVLPAYPVLTPLKLIVNKDTNGNLHLKESFLYSDNAERTISFLSSDYFPGVGKERARRVISLSGNDIFSYINRNIADKDDLSGDMLLLYQKIWNLLSFEKTYKFIMANGGSVYTALKLYEEYRDDTIDRVCNNPYLYYFFGGDYGISEKMAAKSGMTAFDRKRVHALVRCGMDINKSLGNTRITYHNLVKLCQRREQQVAAGFKTSPIFISAELKRDTKDYKLVEEDSTLYVYFNTDYNAEVVIAREIKRLETSKKSISNNRISIEDIENEFHIEYSKSQKRVLSGIRTSGVKIVTGGPGTGKTTLLHGLLYRYREENPDNKILLCSPTGCAAKRMTDATGMEAMTIHRLLKVRPYEKEIIDYKRDELDADLIVCDETSMLDTKLAATFLTAVKNSATVIFLGDKDQLPSVDAGNVLADFIASKTVECYDLVEIFRQEHGSLITDNARKVINGDSDLKTDRSFLIQQFKDENELMKTILHYRKIYEKAGSPGELKIFTPSKNKKFRLGTVNLNQMIKSVQKKDIDLVFGYYSYSIGDRVLFTRNNYEKGYYNGGEGVLKSVTNISGILKVGVELDGKYITLERNDLNDIEPCFAMTAHKAQGSECDFAIIIVPRQPKGMLMRKLLYVEITRAKKQVIILSEGDSYKKAITETRKLTRCTGLCNRLKENKII